MPNMTDSYLDVELKKFKEDVASRIAFCKEKISTQSNKKILLQFIEVAESKIEEATKTCISRYERQMKELEQEQDRKSSAPSLEREEDLIKKDFDAGLRTTINLALSHVEGCLSIHT